MNERYFPPNKSALLEVIHMERDKLDALIEEIPHPLKISPSVEDDWSIKDLMAHIAAWERFAFDRIQAAITGEDLKYPVMEADKWVDEFNHQVFVKNKAATLEAVESEYQAAHKEFIKQIEALEEDFLKAELPFDWADDLTAQVLISANTHWHYQEHADSIQAWFSQVDD